MKIIISHDVDHITAWEHKKDLIIPKFIVRSFIEFGLGYISFFELKSRFKSLVENKWQNIEELMKFDRENRIPSTFFIGVANGLGLSYSLKDAEYWIRKVSVQGFGIGTHGIAFNNYAGIKNEYDIFRNLSGLESIGIRMHYLRNFEGTLGFLDKAGYLFDSSIYKLENPFKVGNLWEFPLHIMDSYIFYKDSKWQNQTLEQAKKETQKIIENAYKKNIEYFTILFHSRSFSGSFKTFKLWYIWLISWLKDNGFEFISYKRAIQELDA
ncbi:hypothetical protein J7L48_08270 [bacterium]|nr:hypothetical protein [bacterium]